MTDAERKEEVDTFNNPSNGKRFLVASVRTGALGLNLHHAADKIVVMDFPENIGFVIQIVGRLHRLGQQHEQRCWIVTVQHTYDQILQANAAHKFIPQLLGEANLPDAARVQPDMSIQDDTEREEALTKAQAALLWDAAAELARRVMGQRCRVDKWANTDLVAARRDDPPVDPSTSRWNGDFNALITPRATSFKNVVVPPLRAPALPTSSSEYTVVQAKMSWSRPHSPLSLLSPY